MPKIALFVIEQTKQILVPNKSLRRVEVEVGLHQVFAIVQGGDWQAGVAAIKDQRRAQKKDSRILRGFFSERGHPGGARSAATPACHSAPLEATAHTSYLEVPAIRRLHQICLTA